MIRGTTTILLFAPLVAALAQTRPAKPEFEVSEVKPNKSGDLRMNASFLPGGEFFSRNAPVIQLIVLAWDVREDAISGAPHWATSDRFEVSARTAAGTEMPTVRLMLQTLLERDFKLQSHIEQRPMDVWVMTVAKSGIKMTNSAAPPKPDCRRVEISDSTAQSECNMTMADLARNLRRMAPAYIDRAVVDQTGLAGTWSFKLSWVAKKAADDGDGPSIFAALEKQAGIKLDLRKIPMPAVVIDRIEKPEGN